MTFRRVVVARTSITGPGCDRESALDWCAENGLAVEKEFRLSNGRGFRIIAARIVRDGSVSRWKATAAQIRRKP